MKEKIILFEGTDLTGKSTITKVMAEKYDLQLRRNSWLISNPIFDKAKECLKIDAFSEAGRKLLIDALKYEIDNYQLEKDTLQDSSTLFRAMAYHYGLDNKRMLDELVKIGDLYPKFDKVYLLSADMNAKLERLKSRKLKGLDDKTDRLVESDPDLTIKMASGLKLYLLEFYNDIIEIDTSGLTIEEALSKVENSYSDNDSFSKQEEG